MGKFHETLDQFGNALELPEEFKSAIQSAYDEDFSGADAKVVGLETAISEKDSAMETMRTDYDSQLSAAKAANWDLLRTGPTAVEEDKGGNIDQNNSDITINDLFG